MILVIVIFEYDLNLTLTSSLALSKRYGLFKNTFPTKSNSFAKCLGNNIGEFLAIVH